MTATINPVITGTERTILEKWCKGDRVISYSRTSDSDMSYTVRFYTNYHVRLEKYDHTKHKYTDISNSNLQTIPENFYISYWKKIFEYCWNAENNEMLSIKNGV